MSLHHTHDPVCPLCDDKVKQAHPTLQEWWGKIKAQFPDAHLSWTFRGEEDQELFFREGKTRARWPNSKHNAEPSLAMDLFQLRTDNVAGWPKPWFEAISFWLGKQNAPIEWGGTWKTIGDGDHFQLKV